MSINSVIGTYGDAAEGAISIHVTIQPDSDAEAILIRATTAGFTFLSKLVLALLDDGDCKFSLEPFGAGSAYFDHAAGGNAGLYLHVQPCVSDIRVFPQSAGIGWLCWAGWFDEVPNDERECDPAFIALEGTDSTFRSFADALQVASTSNSFALLDADQLGFCSSFWRFQFQRRSGTL